MQILTILLILGIGFAVQGGGLLDWIPTFEEFFNMSKQLVTGVPFALAFTLIDEICVTALSGDTVPSSPIEPDLNDVIVELRTPLCSTRSYTLPEAGQLWQTAEFNESQKLVVFVAGWFSTVDGSIVNDMAKAYNCRGDVNFVGVSVNMLLDSLSTWAALNTEVIGESLATLLVAVVDKVQPEDIHLIGHSMGAQIVGAAGRAFAANTGAQLGRITGLDPANPCFSTGANGLTTIQKGDATFIDIIHTNPYAIGAGDAVGDADFYIGDKDIIPPGCLDILCAHFRAFRYYIESVYPGNAANFIALNSLDEHTHMGYGVSDGASGTYLVEVNWRSPYGTNATANYVNPDGNCGICVN